MGIALLNPSYALQGKQMLCIFCLKDKPPSKEHIFPQAIGGTLVIDRVCTQCNGWLGTNVDALLTDHKLILLKRAQLNMRDNTGNVIDFWKKVFGLGTMANDPGQKVRLTTNPKTGIPEPQLIYKSERKTLDDGTEVKKITIDTQQEKDIEKIIERERRRRGLSPLLRDELQAQIESAKTNSRRIEQPEIKYSIQFDVWDYKRTVCKIAYELAWLCLGDEYLDDPVAEQLRNLIFKDMRDDLKGEIELCTDMTPLTLWKSESNAHIGFCSKVHHGVCVSIRIFDSICGNISVSESADKYPTAADGRFVSIHPQTG